MKWLYTIISKFINMYGDTVKYLCRKYPNIVSNYDKFAYKLDKFNFPLIVHLLFTPVKDLYRKYR